MANSTDSKTLITGYNSLPKSVKEWLSSETTAYLVSEINDRLGLDVEKAAIIPNSILRLVTQDLEATEFINEISRELGVNFQTAKAIAEDVEKKVLKPIENDLRREVGIDLKLIYFGKPSTKISPIGPISPIGQTNQTAPTLPPVSHPTEWERLRRVEPAPSAEIPITAPKKPVPPPLEITKKTPEKPLEKPVEISEPFLLHQETFSTADQPILKTPPKSQPSLNIKVQNYYETGEETKKPAPKPVSAKIELPAQTTEMKTNAQNLVANINEQKTRIVHYNEMRTPLTNIGTTKPLPPENRVDLRKFAKPDINTVDLRKKP